MEPPQPPQQQDGGGILTSLPKYEALRASSTNVVRAGNVDLVVDPSSGETLALCSLNTLLPFTSGSGNVPIQRVHENHMAVVLAAHHLNTGDGALVSQVTGLPDRCPVRFTVEGVNTKAAVDVALAAVIDQTRRPATGSTEPLPCAFIGEYASTRTMSLSIVTGILGYPQVSPGATSPLLDDKQQYPLFARTIPSDTGNAVPLVQYFAQVLKARHLAVVNVNNAYGNAFVDGMRAAAKAYDMEIVQIPVSDDADSIASAVHAVQRTDFRLVFCLVDSNDFHDAVMLQAYAQGVAGNGLHNWFYGDYFDRLNEKKIAVDSPLHKAYT